MWDVLPSQEPPVSSPNSQIWSSSQSPLRAAGTQCVVKIAPASLWPWKRSEHPPPPPGWQSRRQSAPSLPPRRRGSYFWWRCWWPMRGRKSWTRGRAGNEQHNSAQDRVSKSQDALTPLTAFLSTALISNRHWTNCSGFMNGRGEPVDWHPKKMKVYYYY